MKTVGKQIVMSRTDHSDFTKESGIIVDQEHLIVSPSGEIYARMFVSSIQYSHRRRG